MLTPNPLRRRLLGLALVCDAAGVAVGAASAAGRWPRSMRWAHHAAYAGACAGTAGAAAACGGSARAVGTLLPAGVALAWLPRTRPGSRTHVAVAASATGSLVAALAAHRVRGGGTGWRPTAGRSRAG